jgi:cyclophilin family peptidyl-prolyl cis-trans isomerase
MRKIGLLLFLGFMLVLGSCGDGFQYVDIQTEQGTMKVKLYNITPKHRDNFVKLVKEGYYDDLLFHRVIQGFMIQGGDPDSKTAAPGQPLGQGGPGYQIDAEFTGGRHFKGALAAARTGDAVNPEKKSSGSQFYIVQGKPMAKQALQAQAAQRGITYTEEEMERYATEGGTPFLDNDYTVFGEVVEGLEVIDKIAALPTGPGNRPARDIKMKIRMSSK